MRLLLDTHILLALIERQMGSLPATIQELVRDPNNEHHLSAASLLEIAIKSRLGKLRLKPSLSALPELLHGLGIGIIAINEQHALAAIEPEPRTFVSEVIFIACQPSPVWQFRRFQQGTTRGHFVA